MAYVTVITPVAPYHLDKLDAVRATVAAQTVPCDHIIVIDSSGRGAGYARNVGLRRVTTPVVVFLDADDALEPTFVARCLQAYDGSAYIYTDWRQGERYVAAPDCPWVNRTWHCVTTLLPTAWAREVDGFDEALIGGEDTDFYLKLTTQGFCGKRLPEPLFHYGKDGRRAAAFVAGPEYKATLEEFTRRYGGKRMACGGCGTPNPDLPPSGEKQVGDILVAAIWGGNRRERGPISGRLYPRTGNGARLWVDPRDAAAAPHLFRRVVDAPSQPVKVVSAAPPAVELVDGDTGAPITDLQTLTRALFPDVKDAPPQPVEPVKAKPNVKRARQLARRSKEETP